MKKLINLLLIGTCLCLSTQTNANIELDKKSLFIPSKLGQLSVTHNGESFHVINQETSKQTKVEKHYVDSNIRNVSTEQLLAFLECGYLEISKLDGPDSEENETFTLKAQTRGPGGGRVTGAIGYWGTKGVCYSGVAAAAFVGSMFPPVFPIQGCIIGPNIKGAAAGGIIGHQAISFVANTATGTSGGIENASKAIDKSLTDTKWLP